jgi:hypothetical protein
MGSAVEAVGSLTSKVPLFSVSLMQSTEPSGMLTPPLHSSALVPFRWEEEPGKPRPCTALATVTNVFVTKCLELPPRLLSDIKLSSPTTVLEGPYVDRSKGKIPWAQTRTWAFQTYNFFFLEIGGRGGMAPTGPPSSVTGNIYIEFCRASRICITYQSSEFLQYRIRV